MLMKYFEAQTLEAACDLLVKYKKDAAILAGGSDLIVKLKENALQKKYLVNIKGIKDLSQIRLNQAENNIVIGALVTHSQLAKSKIIQQYLPALSTASSVIGGKQTRNIGTIGGNICNSSPSAETAPALIAFGALAKIYTPGGQLYTVPIEDFMTGPSKNLLSPGRILKEIVVPLPPKNSGSAYVKLGQRRAMEIAIVNVAVNAVVDGLTIKDIKIALGAVGPIPFRAKKAEDILKGQAIEAGIIQEAAAAAKTECRPITDVRATKEYRSEMVEVMVKRAVNLALEGAKSNLEGVVNNEI